MRSLGISSINMTAARLITAAATAFAAVSFGVIAMPQARAASWNCLSLNGSGTYDDPYVVGRISDTTYLVGCAPFQEGNVKDFFAFTFAAPQSASASVSTMVPKAGSGCRVGLALELNSTIVRSPLAAQDLRTGDGQYGVDHQSLSGRASTGLWQIVPQKLRPITISAYTETYDIEIVP